MAERRPAYDESARERIRAGLKHYMEQHDVGAPTLQLRIAESIEDVPERVPIKSLQRFLAGTHRTDDALVHLCTLFLSQAAPPPPEAQLVDSLSELLLNEPDNDYDFERYCGTYHSFASVLDPAENQMVRTPYSVLTLTPADTPNYLKATEDVLNIDRDPAWRHHIKEMFEPGKREFLTPYSGIFMRYHKNGTFILMVRSYLHMRYCQLSYGGSEGRERGERPDLDGHALEPPIYTVMDYSLFTNEHYEIHYEAAQDLENKYN